MTRYVIGPDVAIRLAQDRAVIRGGHQLLSPVLLRSQVLSLLYQAMRRGEMTRKDAERQLEYVRGLRIRLLGDRVLQNVAWKAAGLLGWPDTFDAEYVALTGTTAGNTAWPSPPPAFRPTCCGITRRPSRTATARSGLPATRTRVSLSR